MTSKHIRIGMFGNQHFSKIVGRSIEEMGYQVSYTPGYKDIDIVYYIGGPGPLLHKDPQFWCSNAKCILIHWIGSDVLGIVQPTIKKKIYMNVYKKITNLLPLKHKVVHLATTDWLLEELHSAGITAQLLPITTIDPSLIKLQESRSLKLIDFLSYAPLGRFEFYGGDRIIELAYRMQRYKFIIVSTDLSEQQYSIPSHPDNLTFSNKISFDKMQQLHANSKCFLRFTEHDGLCVSVLEALYHRLRVFWTYPFPHTILAEDFASMPDKMTAIIDSWTPNDAGHDYVVNNFTVDKWKRDFQALLDTMI
jgi:hypothetical protein